MKAWSAVWLALAATPVQAAVLEQSFACGAGNALSVSLGAPLDAGALVVAWFSGNSVAAAPSLTFSDSSGFSVGLFLNCNGDACAGEASWQADAGAQTFLALSSVAFADAGFYVVALDAASSLGGGAAGSGGFSGFTAPVAVQAGQLLMGVLATDATITSVASPGFIAGDCSDSVFFESPPLDAGTVFETFSAPGATSSAFVIFLASTSLLPDGGATTPDAGLVDAGFPDAGAPDAGAADAGTADAGGRDAGADAGTRPGPDSGPGGELIADLSCGCGSASGPVVSLLLALGLRRTARRGQLNITSWATDNPAGCPVPPSIARFR